MSYGAYWDQAWYAQTNNPRYIDVDEALSLRDENTLKSGDLYCCPNESCKIRLGARKPYFRKTRSGQTWVRGCFRRLPGPRVEKVKRKKCVRHEKSREKGETWKHANVLMTIKSFLEKNGDKYKIESVTELSGMKSHEDEDEADLMIQHTEEIIDGHSELRLICRFQNMRRANKVIKRHFPAILCIDMHRWRDHDVTDRIEYIHQRVEEQYQNIEKSANGNMEDLIHYNVYKYPNLGLSTRGGLGYGSQGTLDLDENHEDFDWIHSAFTDLLDAVEQHNYWSISYPGEHQYHLKNLKIGDYSNFHHLKTLAQGLDFELPPSISIMIQENFSNHVTNIANLGDTLQNQETETRWPQTPALFFGDGQKGVNGFPIGVVESMFIIGQNYSPFIEFNVEQSSKFTANMLDFTNRERERTFSQWYVSYDQSKAEYTYQNSTRKIPDATPENRISWYYHSSIPDLLFWDKLDSEQKENIFKRVCEVYRKLSVFKGRLVVFPLINLSIDAKPQTITDPNKIYERISKLDTEVEYEFGSPLSIENYMFLKWTLLSAKFYPAISAPIIREIQFAVKHSTDELTTRIEIELPLSAMNVFEDSELIEEKVVDILLDRLMEEE